MNEAEAISKIIEVFSDIRKRECSRFNIPIFNVRLDTTLRGHTAAQAVRETIHGVRRYTLRVNIPLFLKNEKEFIEQTLPHELAHFIDFIINGSSSHGVNWRGIMVKMGLEPNRCHSYETQSARVVSRPFRYKCVGCGEILLLTNKLHKQLVENPQSRFHCRGKRLEYLGSTSTLHFE